MNSPCFAACFPHWLAHTRDAIALAQEVTVLTSFPGDSGPGPKDNPDNTGGVGPRHVVDCTDANIVIHDKKTGEVLRRMTQTEFWKNAKPGFTLPKLNDPRMTYDPLAGRWYTVVQAQGGTPYGFLAVSESMDPTQGWKGVRLPMEPANLGMKLGFDRNGVYITFIVMTGDTHTMHGCFAIPKADVIAADGPDLANLQSFSQPGDRILPRDGHRPEQVRRRAGNHPEPRVRQQLLQDVPVQAHLVREDSDDLEGPDHPAEQDVPVAERLRRCRIGRFNPLRESKLRADEARRTTCVYAHGGSIFSCNAAKNDRRLPVRSVLVRNPGERRRAPAGRISSTPRTATTWRPRSPSTRTATSAWAARGRRRRSSLRSAS